MFDVFSLIDLFINHNLCLPVKGCEYTLFVYSLYEPKWVSVTKGGPS